MDKRSLEILKYIAAHDPASEIDIISELGEDTEIPLGYLVAHNFVMKNWESIGKLGHCDMMYRAIVDGHAYLEDKPEKDFDRWLMRIISIWGAITGTAALVIEIVLHFL